MSVSLVCSALRIDASLAPARFFLAFVLLQIGDHARASVQARRLISDQPQMAAAHYVLGRALVASHAAVVQAASQRDAAYGGSQLEAPSAQRLREAERALQRAVELDASVADFAKELAACQKLLVKFGGQN